MNNMKFTSEKPHMYWNWHNISSKPLTNINITFRQCSHIHKERKSWGGRGTQQWIGNLPPIWRPVPPLQQFCCMNNSFLVSSILYWILNTISHNLVQTQSSVLEQKAPHGPITPDPKIWDENPLLWFLLSRGVRSYQVLMAKICNFENTFLYFFVYILSNYIHGM